MLRAMPALLISWLIVELMSQLHTYTDINIYGGNIVFFLRYRIEVLNNQHSSQMVETVYDFKSGRPQFRNTSLERKCFMKYLVEQFLKLHTYKILCRLSTHIWFIVICYVNDKTFTTAKDQSLVYITDRYVSEVVRKIVGSIRD